MIRREKRLRRDEIIGELGLLAEGDGEAIDLVGIEHPAGKLGRLADRDRQHARRQRIERSAMPDPMLGLARLTQRALDRRDALRRAQAQRLVENDPAVDHERGMARLNCRASPSRSRSKK